MKDIFTIIIAVQFSFRHITCPVNSVINRTNTNKPYKINNLVGGMYFLQNSFTHRRNRLLNFFFSRILVTLKGRKTPHRHICRIRLSNGLCSTNVFHTSNNTRVAMHLKRKLFHRIRNEYFIFIYQTIYSYLKHDEKKKKSIT